MLKYESYYKTYLSAIEDRLDEVLPGEAQPPAGIHEAMRYGVFPGGKRFRAVMALAACEACGGDYRDALPAAAALELIHCYSLVHDDLPALDNDAERRGKPSVHMKFGEAMAILAGDGLLTLAFHVLSRVRPAARAVALQDELSTSAGTYGMIGGQVADLQADQGQLSLPMMDFINIHKTGKLIKAAAVAGAISAGAAKPARQKLLRFGECLGLAFQSVDDLMDGDGYTRLLNQAEIRSKSRDLIAQAKREIRSLGKKADKLQALADFLLKRIPGKKYATLDR